MNRTKTSALEYVVATILTICAIAVVGALFYGCASAMRGVNIGASSALDAAAKTDLFTDLTVADRSSSFGKPSGRCSPDDAASFELTGFDLCGNPVRATICCDCGWLGGDVRCRYVSHVRTAVSEDPKACLPPGD